MQIKNSLDAVTVEKIKRSILLGSAGFVVTAVPIILADPSVIAFLQDHMVLGAAVTAFIPVLINGLMQFRKGA